MLIHLIYIYFIINSFIAGYWFNENDRWENRRYAILFSSVVLLFGVVGYLIYLFFIVFSPILGYIYKELSFQYRFRFTDCWDKILLDDNYSEEFRTKEEKLERIKQLTKGFSKQKDRHLKLVLNKYESK